MILIDAFNLIYKFPDLEELMYNNQLFEARQGLIKKISLYHQHRKKKEQIKIIIDGKKKPSDATKKENISNLEIFYSHDYSADFLIKNMIQKGLNPKMITVVTSDKDILKFAKSFKTKMIKSEKFSDLVNLAIAKITEPLKPEKETNPKISAEEISYWEKEFQGE